MKVLTRSRRVRSALKSVLGRMTDVDRRALESVVVRVFCETAWSVYGLAGSINESAGELRPLYPDLNFNDLECRGQIRFRLHLCRMYSDGALRGVVAHEFAHAVRASRRRKGTLADWFKAVMADRRYWHEERQADALAASWGFAREIRSMRNEHRKVIGPFVLAHEPEIRRRMVRRWEWDERRAAEIFSVSSSGDGTSVSLP